MREINFQYIICWKLRGNFKELYKKSISIVGKLDDSLMTEDEIDYYNSYKNDNNIQLFICSSLRLLLNENGYKDYNGPIKIYGKFGIRPTTKTHIGEIWKANILDKKGKVIDTIKSEKIQI